MWMKVCFKVCVCICVCVGGYLSAGVFNQKLWDCDLCVLGNVVQSSHVSRPQCLLGNGVYGLGWPVTLHVIKVLNTLFGLFIINGILNHRQLKIKNIIAPSWLAWQINNRPVVSRSQAGIPITTHSFVSRSPREQNWRCSLGGRDVITLSPVNQSDANQL